MVQRRISQHPHQLPTGRSSREVGRISRTSENPHLPDIFLIGVGIAGSRRFIADFLF